MAQLTKKQLSSNRRAQRAAAKPWTNVTATPLHLCAYLRFARHAVLAFLDPTLSPLGRLYSAQYASYFAEGWRIDCQKATDITDNFLSANQFACVTLNAESLLLHMLWLISEPELRALPFAPHSFSSQQAEEFFRGLRAMFNDPNFTLEGCLQRTSYVQADALIRSRRANDFVFPQHCKHVHMDCVRRPAVPLPVGFTEQHIAATVLAARRRCGA